MLSDTRPLKSLLGRFTGASGIDARAFRSTMVIATFHRVNDWMATDGLTCSSAKFAAFCRFFATHSRVVAFSEQVAGCRAGRDMSGTVSITFDDGYRDNFETAAPILRALQLPATFFVTSGFIGSRVIAPWDTELQQQPGWMSWDQVRALVSQGFEIGNHTDTHIDMARSDQHTRRRELETSQQKIRQELGISTPLFAYPFGGPEYFSESARELVRECGFECCASCYGGVNAVGASPYDLKRIPVVGEWFTTPEQFGFEFVLGRALGRI